MRTAHEALAHTADSCGTGFTAAAAKGGPGSARRGRARQMRAGGQGVVEELRARSCEPGSMSGSKMITNRMYGSVWGRAQCGAGRGSPAPSLASACTKRAARMVSTGVSERGTRWLVVEPFARELPAHPLGTAQWLLPARLAICAAGLLHLGCPAARIAHKTSALLRIPVAIAKEWRRRLKQRQTEKTGSRANEHLTLCGIGHNCR